jgi:hypothetical protein
MRNANRCISDQGCELIDSHMKSHSGLGGTDLAITQVDQQIDRFLFVHPAHRLTAPQMCTRSETQRRTGAAARPRRRVYVRRREPQRLRVVPAWPLRVCA